MDQDKIGKRIKKIRIDYHLTQAQFAKKYGVTYQAVSNWEHGKNLPDISLLQQISKDFAISIEELLGEETSKKRFSKKYLIFGLCIILFFLLIVMLWNGKNNSNFEFKTISASCPNFTISGSISYNDSKTSIYISNVNYCGGDDQTEYVHIECILYEVNQDMEKKISSYTLNQKSGLEEFLQHVVFTVDDYSRTCKIYSNETLYLRINATEENGKITTYKIPLSLNDTCVNDTQEKL